MQLNFDLKTAEFNILPKDGLVIYYGKILDAKTALEYFDLLLEKIDWKHDENVIFGKKITTKRKVSWYGDMPYEYTYSKRKKVALPWTEDLLKLKSIAELLTNENYNSCLLNLYHNGEEGMSWHCDDEKELKENGAIAAISLGAKRKFCFKRKNSKEKIELTLENGSLLLMKNETQKFWLHALPKTKKCKEPRISLTFRTIVK